MVKHLHQMKFTKEFRDFIEKLGANRVKAESELRTLPLCVLPDVIVKYFKDNNDRYVELAKMEYKNNGA